AIGVLHAEGNGRGDHVVRTDRQAVAALAPELGHTQGWIRGLRLDANRVRSPIPGWVLSERDFFPQPDAREDFQRPRKARRQPEPVIAQAVASLAQAVQKGEQEARR